MERSSEDMLCKALDLTRKALEFYKDAQARCPSRLGRAVFTLLVADKLRQTTRLEEIHAALAQGKTVANACILSEDDLQASGRVFDDLASRYGEGSKACKLETELLSMALDVEQACLGFLEEQFRDAREQENRTFLQRVIEEERGHFVLLSDMRYYYEQAGGSAG
jgi:hypothetical protein